MMNAEMRAFVADLTEAVSVMADKRKAIAASKDVLDRADAQARDVESTARARVRKIVADAEDKARGIVSDAQVDADKRVQTTLSRIGDLEEQRRTLAEERQSVLLREKAVVASEKANRAKAEELEQALTDARLDREALQKRMRQLEAAGIKVA